MTRDDFQSDEEWYFYHWLLELEARSLVLEIEYEPPSFQLTPKIEKTWNKKLKTKTKQLTFTKNSELIYTTDFKVKWNLSKSNGILTYNSTDSYTKRPTFYVGDSDISYFEVKPNYDKNNMTRAASHKVAWVTYLYNVNIDIVKPYKLFEKTFTPVEYTYTQKTRKPRTKLINKVKTNLIDIITKVDFFIDNSSTI